jgi:hypothetical protein
VRQERQVHRDFLITLYNLQNWLKTAGINRNCFGTPPFCGILNDRAVIEEEEEEEEEEEDIKNFTLSRLGLKYFALNFLENK